MPSMTKETFNRLRDFIYEHSGIMFGDAKQYLLESRLSARLAELELDNYEQYYMLLTTGPYRVDEQRTLFSRITINETSFFRNMPQLEAFEKLILPKLIEARAATRRLSIWSAACSTGEEPLTLAILVHRVLGAQLRDWNVEVLGTDISERALLKAQEGVYGAYATRSVPPLLLNQYFEGEGEEIRVIPEVRKLVRFDHQNLMDHAGARRRGTWDAIFCRNVLIYFDDTARSSCFSLFHKQLNPDGVLVLGHSEQVRSSEQFVPRPEPGAFAYMRADAAEVRHAA